MSTAACPTPKARPHFRRNAEHPERFMKVGYCALTGLVFFLRGFLTQGVALGYNMAPFQGSVQKKMPSPNGAK